MRDLIAVFVEQRDVQYSLELFVGIIADVGFGTLGFQEIITLLPDTNGVRFNARQILQVLYSKRIHAIITIPAQKSCRSYDR